VAGVALIVLRHVVPPYLFTSLLLAMPPARVRRLSRMPPTPRQPGVQRYAWRRILHAGVQRICAR